MAIAVTKAWYCAAFGWQLRYLPGRLHSAQRGVKPVGVICTVMPRAAAPCTSASYGAQAAAE